MGMTLPMYLITPVQRIPRYILLLKVGVVISHVICFTDHVTLQDIIKRTPDTHPDYKQLQQSLGKMVSGTWITTDVVNHTHTKQRKASSYFQQEHSLLVRPVLCNSWSPGKELTGGTNCASHCLCGHLLIPQLPLVDDETRPVCYVQTRYPFYRWVGWIE